MDTVHFAMGKDQPLSVSANGGNFHIHDRRDTPDTQEVIWEYPGFLVHYALDAQFIRKSRQPGNKPFSGLGIQFHSRALLHDRNGSRYRRMLTTHETGGWSFPFRIRRSGGLSFYYTVDGVAGDQLSSTSAVCESSNALQPGKTDRRHRGRPRDAAPPPRQRGVRGRRKLIEMRKPSRWSATTKPIGSSTRSYRSPWKLPGLDG